MCLVFKVTHDLAPPPLAEYINRRTGTDRVTRGSSRGDCVIPLRKSTFNQSAWSVKSAKEWNLIPQHNRELNTYMYVSALKSFVVACGQHTMYLFYLFFRWCSVFCCCCFTLVSQFFSLFCDALFCAVGFRPVYVVVVFILFNCISISRGLQMKNSLLANSFFLPMYYHVFY